MDLLQLFVRDPVFPLNFYDYQGGPIAYLEENGAPTILNEVCPVHSKPATRFLMRIVLGTLKQDDIARLILLSKPFASTKPLKEIDIEPSVITLNGSIIQVPKMPELFGICAYDADTYGLFLLPSHMYFINLSNFGN